MAFSNPLALAALIILPGIIWLGRPLSKGAWREWLSLVLRCILVVLVILSLAGAQAVRASDELAVVYLVDASDSIPPAERERAVAWVADAIEALQPGDRAAVVLFGADALVERPLSYLSELAPVSSVPQSLQTDIDGAIRLGLALLPAGTVRRLVIISDGVETMGDAAESSRLAAASGVKIDVHPLGVHVAGQEAMLAAVSAPTRLTEGDRFDLTVRVERSGELASAQPASALLRVMGDSGVVYEEAVSLSRGENHFTIPLQAGEPGFSRYRVQIVPIEDEYYQNNELAAYTEILGPPRVLLVSLPERIDADGMQEPDESDELARALLAVGMSVDRSSPRRLPVSLPTLSEYAAVVLVNVNAKDLSPRKMSVLETYVRDLGGGLVVVGGPQAFAPGGYYRTPLENALPVEMQLKDQERRANLAMVFVIDKSGSMSDTSVGGIPKVELAKEAIVRSLGLLSPLDRAGVVAFDDTAFWVVPIEEVSDPDGMAGQVGTIRASGGTDILAGLQAVAEAIPDDPATLKHIILLTDGGASESGNPEITQRMVENDGATLSVVAIGDGYAPWIETLPDIGQGRFHFAYDPDTIPEIFTQETTLATRAYIIEEEFWPTQTQRHPIMGGITAAPPLYGYIGTSPKQAAQVILITEQDDPLLAAWQYGLGRSVAWTSDATGRWASEWVGWPNFARFWEQVVKWTISQERGSNVQTDVHLENGRAVVTVETAGADGRFLNGLEIDVRMVDPGNQPRTIVMQQVAPGRYQGEFEPEQEGVHMLRVAGTGSVESVAQTAGWVLGYSPEYQVTEPAHDRLLYLANLTGGKELIEPWESLSHDPSAGQVRRPIWDRLLLLVVIMLPLDVALRRLVLSRDDLIRVWNRVRSVVPAWLVPGSRPDRAPSRPERVSRLFEAKGRAKRQEPSTPDHAHIGDEPRTALPVRPVRSDRPSKERDQAESTGGTLAGRLLDSKKKRIQEPDE